MPNEMLKPKWIVRIVVGLALVVGVVLAAIDYRAKSAAKQTADAWLELVGPEKFSTTDQLDEHIVGSPDLESEDFKEKNMSVRKYTWSGTLRSYHIEVTTTMHGDLIRSVDGPNSD